MPYKDRFNEIKIEENNVEISEMQDIAEHFKTYLLDNLKDDYSSLVFEDFDTVGSLGSFTVSRTKEVLDIDISIYFEDITDGPGIRNVKNKIKGLLSSYDGDYEVIDGSVQKRKKVVSCSISNGTNTYDLDIVPIAKDVDPNNEFEWRIYKEKEPQNPNTGYTTIGKVRKNGNYNANINGNPYVRATTICMKMLINKDFPKHSDSKVPSFYLQIITEKTFETKDSFAKKMITQLEWVKEDLENLFNYQGEKKQFIDDVFERVVANNQVDNLIESIDNEIEWLENK